jgi:hypothetical protein
MAKRSTRKSQTETHSPVVVRTTRLACKVIQLTTTNKMLTDALSRIITAWEVNRNLDAVGSSEPGVNLTTPFEEAKAVLAAAQEAATKRS